MADIKPLVFKKGEKQRLGKGFSLSELKKTGLNPKQALKLKIPIDPRRKTSHEENIETLKKLLAEREKTSKPKPKPKKEIKRETEQKKEKTKRGKKEKSKT